MRKFCLIRFPLHVSILTDYLLIVSRKKTGSVFVFQKTITNDKTGKIKQQIKFPEKIRFFPGIYKDVIDMSENNNNDLLLELRTSVLIFVENC